MYILIWLKHTILLALELALQLHNGNPLVVPQHCIFISELQNVSMLLYYIVLFKGNY